MVTSRVMLHFDDLLSVINDAQLKSALNAYKEILQLIKRSSEQRKSKAGEKLTVRRGFKGKSFKRFITNRLFFYLFRN